MVKAWQAASKLMMPLLFVLVTGLVVAGGAADAAESPLRATWMEDGPWIAALL